MKAVTVKYLPHNGKRGARLQASDSDRNRVQVPYDLPGEDNEDRAAKWRRAAVALYAKMKWSRPERLVMGWIGDSEAVFVYPPYPTFEETFGDPAKLRPCVSDSLDEMRRKAGVRGSNMMCAYAQWRSGGASCGDQGEIEAMINDLLCAYGSDCADLLERLVR